MSAENNLPYCRLLFRSKEGVELFSIPSERDDEAGITKRGKREFLIRGSTSFQKVLPDGSAAFVHRPDQGIFKLNLGSGAVSDTESPFLQESARVQILAMSPQGSYMLTWERAKEGETPNMKVWSTKTGEFVIGFRQKGLSRDSWPYVQWTNDEKLAFLLGTNEVRVYPGTFPQGAETRFVDKMKIPGISSMSVPSESTGALRILFTSFCPKDKNRPSRASLYEYPSKTPAPANEAYPALLTKSLFQAEEMKVYWSPKGDSALIALDTTVDTSGESYYGSTSLYLMSPQETDTIAVPLPQEGPVLDVAWMPNPAKPPQFTVVAGKMPSMASLHNGNDGKATFLFGNAHRNTIAWAPHGRFVCLAGFGNLAGGMTFWDRNKCKQIPPAVPVTASCTVGYGWSPDSRLVVVSTTSPRMNVDNGVSVYRYNGDKMTNLPWNNEDYKPDRLLEATFLPAASTVYPDRPQSPTLKDATPPAGSAATSAVAESKPTGRYVPPSARNRPGRGGPTLAERIAAEKQGKMKGAQKVEDKPKSLLGATGKVVVGMAPPVPQGKSKSSLRREKAKQKKDEEEARKALEEKVLVEEKQADEATSPAVAVDPEKRGRKITKMLKQIDDLKAKDPSTLNEDQKTKVESEADLRKELLSLGIQ
jgi:translation initiation factor 2A